MTLRRAGRACLAVFGLLILAGCGTVGFDPAAYQSAVQLKYETLTLVDQSSGRYAPNKAAAEALMRKYADAAETMSKSAGNTSVAQQWAAIRDPRGASAGNLLEIWKVKGPLRPGQRVEKKRAIAQHFDHLICLESSKQAPTECGEVGSVPEESGAAAPAPKPAPRRSAAPKPVDADEPELEPEQPPK
jgi:hypothetical protein